MLDTMISEHYHYGNRTLPGNPWIIRIIAYMRKAVKGVCEFLHSNHVCRPLVEISLLLGVCCASRNQHQKIAEQAIFTLQTPKVAHKSWFLRQKVPQKPTSTTDC
jgi:hypothetical protein